ncbi:MAG TPA: outer membrane beta-barrel protein [Terriglobales bacterium]|nr:outer membrane beta-barrel protein [Terriglobales bacterium]
MDCCIGPLDKAIADGKGSLEKALGIGISGYLDTGWTLSTNHPSKPSNISLRYFDKDQNKIEFNDFNLTLDKPEKDWGVGFHLSGDFGRTAELLREATFWGRSLHKEPSAELREAYFTTTIPVGEGLAVKGGLFVTPLGTEIIPSPGAYNDNISRSFLFNLGVPLRHLGMLLTYPINKMVGVSGGVVTGWDDPRDNNHQPSFLGGFTLNPSDTISFASNLTAGEEPVSASPPSARNTARFTISNVLTVKTFDPLNLSAEYTYGRQNKASLGGTLDAVWQGVAAIASYGWTDRFTTALRGEVFFDRNGARTGGDLNNGRANVTVGELTLTGAYKFTKMFLGRAEVRQDWSDRNVFAVGDQTNRTTHFGDKSQTTLALQLIYTF